MPRISARNVTSKRLFESGTGPAFLWTVSPRCPSICPFVYLLTVSILPPPQHPQSPFKQKIQTTKGPSPIRKHCYSFGPPWYTWDWALKEQYVIQFLISAEVASGLGFSRTAMHAAAGVNQNFEWAEDSKFWKKATSLTHKCTERGKKIGAPLCRGTCKTSIKHVVVIGVNYVKAALVIFVGFSEQPRPIAHCLQTCYFVAFGNEQCIKAVWEVEAERLDILQQVGLMSRLPHALVTFQLPLFAFYHQYLPFASSNFLCQVLERKLLFHQYACCSPRKSHLLKHLHCMTTVSFFDSLVDVSSCFNSWSEVLSSAVCLHLFLTHSFALHAVWRRSSFTVILPLNPQIWERKPPQQLSHAIFGHFCLTCVRRFSRRETHRGVWCQAGVLCLDSSRCDKLKAWWSEQFWGPCTLIQIPKTPFGETLTALSVDATGLSVAFQTFEPLKALWLLSVSYTHVNTKFWETRTSYLLLFQIMRRCSTFCPGTQRNS